MYFNHRQLTSSTTTVGDPPLHNICQELTITPLPGNQFIVTPQKASVTNQEYTRFDTISSLHPPHPEITHPTFYTVYIFYLRITFNSTTTTVIILNADFTDVHEISLTKTLYIVYFALK